MTDAQSNDFARFAGEAAATHQLALAGGAPQALDTQSPAALGESLSKVLNSDIRFRPSQATTPAIMGAHLVPVPGGQAAQLTLRDGSDIVTLTMQSRPGAEETPLRRVTAGDVTTIVWQDDEHGLICALTGTAAPAKLEQLAQRVYRDLLF